MQSSQAHAVTSGAMYSTVPTGETASSCFVLIDRPKSPRRISFLDVKKMFSSLTSLSQGDSMHYGKGHAQFVQPCQSLRTLAISRWPLAVSSGRQCWGAGLF